MEIQAYHFHPDGAMDTLTELPSPQELDKANGSLWWLDIEGPSGDDIDQLAAHLSLDPATVEDLKDDDARADIDYFDDYISLLLYGMLGRAKGDVPQPRQMGMLCFSNIVVTVRDLPMGSVSHVARRAKKSPKLIASRGVGHLVFLLLDKMVDNCMSLAKRYEEELEELEDRSVDIDCGDELLEDLSDVRRRVLQLWKIAIAQREVLIELCEEGSEHLPPESLKLLEQVRDHMTSTMEIVEILRTMVSEVRENYRTTISLRSAEASQQLTVFAGLLLPPSAIAAIYGMNVPLWPNPNDPRSFWVLISIMVAVIAGQLVYFRRRRWI